MQLVPPPHTLPHAPQWLSFDAKLTSQPLAAARSQSPKPALHTKLHAPDAHTPDAFAGDEHTVPHAPQLSGSERVVTQSPPHTVCPVGQRAEHVPPRHTVPAAHTRPQAPQWLLSVAVSRHTPPQFVVPATQLTTHAPSEHTVPAAHTVPHDPQFARSVCTSRHTLPQAVSPVGQSSTQRPAAHT